MTDITATVERRRSHCPNCQTRAIPFSIRPGPGIVIVTNRCETCSHEWTAEYSASEILQQRSRDREEAAKNAGP